MVYLGSMKVYTGAQCEKKEGQPPKQEVNESSAQLGLPAYPSSISATVREPKAFGRAKRVENAPKASYLDAREDARP